MLIGRLKQRLKIEKFRRSWREKNTHNTTMASSIFDIDKVSVGNYTYGNIDILDFGTNEKLSIGSFCSIAPNVKFILNADHCTNYFTTFPLKVKVLQNQDKEGISKGDIIVGDDVWLGLNAVILSGVTIGQGAIIAAGAVVTKNVPPYAIVGGNPARIIKYRFEAEIIDKLLKVNFSKLSKYDIEKHIKQMYIPLVEVKQLDWIDDLLH
ncbi:CatB-related O-acetyltransferase [Streptococcus pneumoniae]|uniref:Putative acetyl transferase n=1 Tax=Streptococcus pneumoniae TaxID=1313 RepID=Q4K1D2_STREE|nr:CatB-related O-acetyltransferase [Streptococcus pneumoniae]MDG7640513.1 CatB-related O-acetyltransferase [Streptococcus pneumoniae]MDG8930163.1 CatB-related O-acetyltransferase [Streptococcus pneumoniae]MDG9055205.1 CatB-related O-acetyltransferase [Streptococcus pneumoniae]MDG9192948.1 CatB-related O-acetyltransferase [Streptococcus pneumoniae]